MALVNPLASIPYEEEEVVIQPQGQTLLEPQAYAELEGRPNIRRPRILTPTSEVESLPVKKGMGGLGRIAGVAGGVFGKVGQVIGHPGTQAALFLGAPLLMDKFMGGGGGPQVSPEQQTLDRVAALTPPDDYMIRQTQTQMELNKLRGFGYY
jgi:hypothetical protein